MSKTIQTFEQKLHLSPQQILEAKILQLNLSSLEKKIIDESERKSGWIKKNNSFESQKNVVMGTRKAAIEGIMK